MTNFEKQIADEIAQASGTSVKRLGLRFDKVVVRLLAELRAFVEPVSFKEDIVLVTVTAPIRLAAKTERELEERITDFLKSANRHQDQTATIFQNEVRLRIIKRSSKKAPKLIGFVHNPGTDSKLLLDLAARWLPES